MPRTLPLPKGNEKIWLHLLPRESLRKHGRHVYMFRNTQTNQIVYTHHPKIEQRTLKQLPFIGKHSVPPRIRPDLWKAHCRIGPFPTAKQGRDALKKLRELRKLHELNWKETNPEWSKEPKRRLIRNIMNQRANASADLAKVLSIQAEMGAEMATKRAQREQEQAQYLKKKWAQIKALAKSGHEGAIQKLLKTIQDCEKVREQKMDDDKEVHRLEETVNSARKKVREITWAQKMVKKEADIMSKFRKSTTATATAKAKESDPKLLEGNKVEETNEVRIPARVNSYEVRESLLPKSLVSLPVPYKLTGIECHWADLLDSQYAGEWPKAIKHSSDLEKKVVVTEEEYNMELDKQREEVEKMTQGILEELEFKAENERRVKEGLPKLKWQPKEEEAPIEEVSKPRSGVMKYMPNWFANLGPVKRMTA